MLFSGALQPYQALPPEEADCYGASPMRRATIQRRSRIGLVPRVRNGCFGPDAVGL